MTYDSWKLQSDQDWPYDQSDERCEHGYGPNENCGHCDPLPGINLKREPTIQEELLRAEFLVGLRRFDAAFDRLLRAISLLRTRLTEERQAVSGRLV